MKNNLHYHSDCYFFGGCENMVANFLNSDEIHKEFNISFSYRESYLYNEGFKKRVHREIDKKGLFLICWPTYLGMLNETFPKILSNVFKGVSLVLQFKVLFLLLNTIFLYFHFRNKKIDILHINNGGYPAATSANSAVIAARIVGIKKIYYIVNNIIEPYTKVDRFFDKPLDFFIKKSVTKFITGSLFAGETLKKTLDISSEKYQNINNGISLRKVSESREEVLTRINAPSESIIIGVVANLEERKGHKFLLNAFRRLCDECSENLPFLIIEGSGQEKVNITNQIKRLSLEGNVLMIEREEHIFNLINSFDILVLPSISNEDFPNIILEGMSLGKPVIGTRIAGIPEQIDQGKSGYIIEPMNEEDLLVSMRNMMNDSELRDQFGRIGRKKFEEKFEVRVSIRNYIDLYKQKVS